MASGRRATVSRQGPKTVGEDYRVVAMKLQGVPLPWSILSPRPARLSLSWTGDLVSIASTCCQSIANSYPHRSSFELEIQSSNPPVSSDTQPIGFATRLDLSTVDKPAPMDDRQFLSSGCTPDLSEYHDIPSFEKLLARSKQVIVLTLNDDIIEVSWLSITQLTFTRLPARLYQIHLSLTC